MVVLSIANTKHFTEDAERIKRIVRENRASQKIEMTSADNTNLKLKIRETCRGFFSVYSSWGIGQSQHKKKVADIKRKVTFFVFLL